MRKRKKRFSKPEVTRVKLARSEALLNGCKSTFILVGAGVDVLGWVCTEVEPDSCMASGS